MNLQVNEIFASIQGEGRWTGLPCVFLRLQGCNLDPPCAWCDTPDALTMPKAKTASIGQVLDEINKRQPRTVVVTGGEPVMQASALEELIILDDNIHNWHLETNGTLPIPDVFDWVTVSPKRRPDHEWNELTMSLANEIKFVVADLVDIKWVDHHYCHHPRTSELSHIWLQPVSNNPEMINHCIAWLLGKHNPYQKLGLSVQTHKFLGVR